jgi:hypothetical protein
MGSRLQTSKIVLLMEWSGVHNYLEHIQRLNINTKLVRSLGSRWFYWLYEATAFRNTGKLIINILDSTRLINGEWYFRNTWEGSKEEWKKNEKNSLYNAYEVKNYKLKLKDSFKGKLPDDTKMGTQRRIQYFSSGNEAKPLDTDKTAFTRQILGRILLQHRSWMPLSLQKRFMGKQWNPAIEDYDVGYYKGTLIAIKEMFAEANGLKLMLSQWGKLPNWQKVAVRRTIYDMAFVTASAVFASILANLAGDADDDDWWINYMSFQANRILLEARAMSIIPTTTFLKPFVDDDTVLFGTVGGNDILTLYKSPAAIGSLLDDVLSIFNIVTDWKEIERGMYKGHTKTYKFMIRNSVLKSLYEIQNPKVKNNYLTNVILD